MFADQQRLTVDDLKSKATALSMNAETFATCLDSGKHAETIRKDQDEARKAGVSSTPTMFINGRLLSGNQPYTTIRDIIEDELKRPASK